VLSGSVVCCQVVFCVVSYCCELSVSLFREVVLCVFR